MVVASLRNAIQTKHRERTMQRCIHSSDVTISKFRFSIDFDSIFNPKWRFRFDSIIVTPTLNHSRQNSVTTDAGGRLQSDLLPLQNRRRLIIDVNSRGTYQQTTHCPWPVTKPPRVWHLQTSKWQVTTMFPRSNLSRTTHLQHSQKLDAWHGWKLLLLANSSVNKAWNHRRHLWNRNQHHRLHWVESSNL